MALNIVITGAGIAGLAAAIGARRAGHHVTIYEKSSFANETGAAMWVPPNITKPLFRWGFKPALAKLVAVEGSTYQDPFSLNVLHSVPMGKAITERYGAGCYFAHRVDLHQELKRLATQEAGPGYPVRIELKSEVLAYDVDAPSITLVNSQVVPADVVIAADGVHSLAAKTILENQPEPQTSELYNYTYRFLIPTADLMKDLEIAAFLKTKPGHLVVLPDQSALRRLVCYPCRDGTLYNFSGPHFKANLDEKAEDWHASIDKSHMEKTFEGFHPVITRMIAKAEDVKCWPLLHRDPIPTWTKGGVLLIGDAAHPMLPNQGQGGAQAIEDAVALGIALCGASRVDVPKRLRAVEKIRIDRASAMQILSGAGQEEVALVAQKAAPYFESGNTPVPRNPKELFEFAFSYDVVDDSIRHMASLDPQFQVPVSFMLAADVV